MCISLCRHVICHAKHQRLLIFAALLSRLAYTSSPIFMSICLLSGGVLVISLHRYFILLHKNDSSYSRMTLCGALWIENFNLVLYLTRLCYHSLWTIGQKFTFLIISEKILYHIACPDIYRNFVDVGLQQELYTHAILFDMIKTP